jgi:hypothetical protein
LRKLRLNLQSHRFGQHLHDRRRNSRATVRNNRSRTFARAARNGMTGETVAMDAIGMTGGADSRTVCRQNIHASMTSGTDATDRRSIVSVIQT